MFREMIETGEGAALGYKIDLGNGKLLLIKADVGYLACGYFNPKTIEKMGDIAVIISGTHKLEKMLDKKPCYVSEKAQKIGITEEMTGEECLNQMIRGEEVDLDNLVDKDGGIDEIQL